MPGLLLGAAIGLAVYILIYFNFIKGPKCKSERSLKGKTVVITGANTGIGKMTALDLAQRGARVILACRNKERAETAVYDIRKESGNREVLFMKLDLASLASIRAFAALFMDSEPRLDILINNAGVCEGDKTVDGYNLIFGVNHLGHFLLTQLLLERLKHCAPSRIVIVASSAYCNGRINFENLNSLPGGWIQDYCNSKLANVLHARELASKLEGTNVTCYAVHPGFVNTELFRNLSPWRKLLLYCIAGLFFRNCTDGAQTLIHCAVQEGIELYSGRYFSDCRAQEVRPHARDDGVAKKLWEVSEHLVDLAG
ncbi:dehydrogenase/reductase SDR family member 13 [Rhinatrema bivittatum]|uniref:dehydrogenase/reductase SDR family member 13 n=1 Tax=Rhinatrema bivittatum TaxID=194408 RepID=UPI00112BA739|nr:dehydrogenase/reductase SDR family member 13 [Rhinatrema bivittatum]